MTSTPEPPPARDDESGAADDRFDRRIAFGVVAALAVIGAVGPFGWHLFSNGSGGSTSAGAAVAAAGNGNGGGAGSNGNAAVASPAAASSTASPSANPTSSNPAAASASAACAAALGNAGSVSGSNGTTAAIGNWAIMATPSVNALRANAANLNAIVIRHDAVAVPTAAQSLCDEVGSVGKLAAMPDTVGATAWQAALSAYVAGATDALAAAKDPAYYQAAQAQIAQGEQELNALSARIIATT